MAGAAGDDGSEFELRELFGGAMTIEIPRRFTDVSTFRQVRDRNTHTLHTRCNMNESYALIHWVDAYVSTLAYSARAIRHGGANKNAANRFFCVQR